MVRLERHGDAAIVAFARPPVNAIDLELAAAFHARMDELAADVPRGGVVVTGDGPTFSAGVDVEAAPGYAREQAAAMVTHINAAMTLLYGLPTATVAAVNGHAIGGAFVVMLACDARVAADAPSRLSLAEVTAGIPFPACPMEVVKAEVEPGLRRHLVLSGDELDPRGAHARGIVDELVAADELLPRALEIARARSALRAYARVKEQLRGATLARMRAVAADGSDPMLAAWI